MHNANLLHRGRRTQKRRNTLARIIKHLDIFSTKLSVKDVFEELENIKENTAQSNLSRTSSLMMH
jgi:hypothetical protein